MNPVTKLANLSLTLSERGHSYGSAFAQIALGSGLQKLGVTYLEVPPGKSSCPFHVHHVDDEMFVLLEGKGRYRFGQGIYDVEAGDVLSAPSGGAEFAHKLTNIGATTLKYLAISTKARADICEYPDSGKFQVGTRTETFRYIGRATDPSTYWDGEPDSAF